MEPRRIRAASNAGVQSQVPKSDGVGRDVTKLENSHKSTWAWDNFLEIVPSIASASDVRTAPIRVDPVVSANSSRNTFTLASALFAEILALIEAACDAVADATESITAASAKST
ncbi:hypothetical protein D3C75_533010 [compost metagenome]